MSRSQDPPPQPSCRVRDRHAGLFAGRSRRPRRRRMRSGADLPLVDDPRQPAIGREAEWRHAANRPPRRARTLAAPRAIRRPRAGRSRPSVRSAVHLQVPAPAHPRPPGHDDRRHRPQRPRQAAASSRTLRARRYTLPADRGATGRGAGGPVRRAATAGTYHYWATTTGMPLAFRGVDQTASCLVHWSSTRRTARVDARPRAGHHGVDEI